MRQVLIGTTGASGEASAPATAAQQKQTGLSGPAGPRHTAHTPGPGESTLVHGTRGTRPAADGVGCGTSAVPG